MQMLKCICPCICKRPKNIICHDHNTSPKKTKHGVGPYDAEPMNTRMSCVQTGIDIICWRQCHLWISKTLALHAPVRTWIAFPYHNTNTITKMQSTAQTPSYMPRCNRPYKLFCHAKNVYGVMTKDAKMQSTCKFLPCVKIYKKSDVKHISKCDQPQKIFLYCQIVGKAVSMQKWQMQRHSSHHQVYQI